MERESIRAGTLRPKCRWVDSRVCSHGARLPLYQDGCGGVEAISRTRLWKRTHSTKGGAWEPFPSRGHFPACVYKACSAYCLEMGLKGSNVGGRDHLFILVSMKHCAGSGGAKERSRQTYLRFSGTSILVGGSQLWEDIQGLLVAKSERSTDEKDRAQWRVRTLDKGEAEFYLDWPVALHLGAPKAGRCSPHGL